MIDVTWNDTDGEPNEYFLLTDAQANETRMEDTEWMVDSLLTSYAAN